MLPRVSTVECKDCSYLLFATDDYISNQLFRTGQWEDHLIQISKFFLQEIQDPLILDIGANLGAYSIPLAKHIQQTGGTVIGFEPQRIVYYQLCGNIILNRLNNYHAINCAIGDTDGFIEIPEPNFKINSNFGAFSLKKEFREQHGFENYLEDSTSKVILKNLDNFQVMKSPSMIKIDVEGFELNVLKGAENFLAEHSYPPLIFEAWNTDWFIQGKKDLMSFVSQIGYKITTLGTTDYIAQHPENSVKVDFAVNDHGLINMIRVK